MSRRIMDQHSKYKDKSMDELIDERTKRLSTGQNELRKKWIPEKYNPHLKSERSH